MLRRTIFRTHRTSYKGYLGVIEDVDTVNTTPSLKMANSVANRNYQSWAVTYTTSSGVDIINDNHVNKGTAFTREERERLGIRGMLPARVTELHKQMETVEKSFSLLTNALDKYDFAIQVCDRNETLFYYWLMNNIETLAPIIYTPTVGDACLRFGVLFKRTRGMFFSPDDQTHFLSMIYNWPHEVDVVVVTDGGRILGLGDLGAHGMPIPVGKLSLYTAVGGIHPLRGLPIVLDVGTNNLELRKSGTYFGWDGERIQGEEYYLMVDELMRAIKRRWPTCLVQFEDFTSTQAPIILETYQKKMNCFNDDIQGTGAVVVAAIMNALRLQKRSIADLASTRILILGGGSATYGVAKALHDAMQFEKATPEQASLNMYVYAIDGILTTEQTTGGFLDFVGKDLSADPHGITSSDKPSDVVKKFRPNVIIGLTGCHGAFTEDIIRSMSEINERPVILPLSNPTSRAECSFEDAVRWSDGRCIFGSGSPFSPVEHHGVRHVATQTNNMYVFPGVGLGSVLCKTHRINDLMFYEASKALALYTDDATLEARGTLFPPIAEARKISIRIALAVMKSAMQQNLHRKEVPLREAWIAKHVYVPRYGPIVRSVPEEVTVRDV